MSFFWWRSGPFQTLPRHWHRLRHQVRFQRKQFKKLGRVRHPDIAPCNHQTPQGATRTLRTLRLSLVAPCNVALSHLATFTCRTLRLKNPPLWHQTTTLHVTAPPLRPCLEPTIGFTLTFRLAEPWRRLASWARGTPAVSNQPRQRQTRFPPRIPSRQQALQQTIRKSS